jgi:diacylglycerol kinase
MVLNLKIMNTSSFSIKKRIKSFGYAINGIKILIRCEHNARIHLIVAICTIMAGIVLGISNGEWIAIVFAIGFVFAMETINTSIEHIADFVCPQQNAKIKIVKDLTAAGVLISAFIALTIGGIVFIPKIIGLCSNY